MTPANELRQAAATLRALSANATPGPWDGDLNGVNGPGGNNRIAVGPWAGVMDGDDARWIATMSPAVAEPLAKLLDWGEFLVTSHSPQLGDAEVLELLIEFARQINEEVPRD